MVDDDRTLERTSRWLALVLRHKPEEAGLTLDREGWATIPDVLEGLRARGYPSDRGTLEAIVSTDSKGRYVISPDGRKVRAAQGHSISVDLSLQVIEPPQRLWHGTVAGALPSIRIQGLTKQRRQHVHLSGTRETAIAVGSRRGKPVVLPILAEEMHAGGHAFYRAENGVYLADSVAPEFVDWSEIEFLP